MKRLLLLVPLVVLALSGCYPGQHVGPVDQNADNLMGARFAQSQAVQGFDTSSYTLSDDQVDQFRDLLVAHDVDPGDYTTPDTAGCAGGITTRVQMQFSKNGDKEMIVDGCAAADGSFEQEATDFFSGIRTGAASTTSNEGVIALTVTADGLPTIPDGSYIQDDATQIARMVSLLDAHDVDLAALGAEGVTISALDPCDFGGSLDIEARYADASPDASVSVRPCDTGTGFIPDLVALAAEWAEAAT